MNHSIIVLGFVIVLALSVGSAGAVDCECGNICVNETGWWHDGGTFNLSGTPIQAAVDNASENDVICVKDGTYSDNVDVNVDHLTIRSENGSGSTMVQAASSSDHVFDITADYVNISGFTVTGATSNSKSKAGIFIHGTKGNPALNISIKNCISIENDAGIYLKRAGVKYCVIENNTCSENEYGLRIRNAKENNVRYNSFITNEYGIHLSNADSNNISCNYIFNNSYGIYLKAGSTDNTIECNNIIANGEYNQTSGGYEWQFYNDQEEDISATNNWWDTTDDNETNASIYDWQDNPEKGNVTYLPKLGGPSSCAEIPEPVTLVMVALGLLSVIGLLYRSGASGR